MKTFAFAAALLGAGLVVGAAASALSPPLRAWVDAITHIVPLAGHAAHSHDHDGPEARAPHRHDEAEHVEGKSSAEGNSSAEAKNSAEAENSAEAKTPPEGKNSTKSAEHAEEEGHVRLSAEQIAAADITVADAEPGMLGLHVVVPGIVQPDPDRLARIAGRVVGTVAELRKRVGDRVAAGEVVAVLDSREVAEAKSEYFAARTNLDLQQTLFEREKSLFEKRISAEQPYLRARTTFTEAQLRLELAVQKLQALGLGDDEIAGLERRTDALRVAGRATPAAPAAGAVPVAGLQRYTVRSPIAGQVVERLVNLGAPMGGEGENKELYVVADLSAVWIELAVPTNDLDAIKQGAEVSLSAGDGPASRGTIVFVSPMLNPETRSARVIASVANDGLRWRPGSYVTARVSIADEPVALRVPKAALQTVAGRTVVFVRTDDGFALREITTGRADDGFVEVLSGLQAGAPVAVRNSFVLKAELGKAEAEHAH